MSTPVVILVGLEKEPGTRPNAARTDQSRDLMLSRIQNGVVGSLVRVHGDDRVIPGRTIPGKPSVAMSTTAHRCSPASIPGCDGAKAALSEGGLQVAFAAGNIRDDHGRVERARDNVGKRVETAGITHGTPEEWPVEGQKWLLWCELPASDVVRH